MVKTKEKNYDIVSVLSLIFILISILITVIIVLVYYGILGQSFIGLGDFFAYFFIYFIYIPLSPILVIILSLYSRHRVNKYGYKGKNLYRAGLIFGIALLISIIIYLFVFCCGSVT